MKRTISKLKGTRKSANPRIIGLLILCSLLTLSFEGASEEISGSPPFAVVENAINRFAHYLLEITKENGMFEYRTNMDPIIKLKKKYNILRHAGTLYAMSMYYERHPDKNMWSAIERAGKYLQNESILPIPEKDNMRAIWSKPEVNGSGKPLQVKLGGTGLGLVASELDEYMKGSFGMYDVSAEMVVLKKIESQTDPETEKVILDGMALKFEYFYNTFRIIDGYQVASVYFSDKDDIYIFDYYVAGDKVVKIVLYLKNEEEINKQIFPQKKESGPEKKE